jgi:uroporphyrinogen-III synthase
VIALGARVAFLAIGPTTSGALRGAGARVAIESSSPAIEAVVDALGEYFAASATAQTGTDALRETPARSA